MTSVTRLDKPRSNRIPSLGEKDRRETKLKEEYENKRLSCVSTHESLR